MRARSAVRAVPRRAPARAGFTLFELLVAFSILSVIVSVSGGLLVRHKRLLASARHQRIAVEELANQMDRLMALDRGAREAFLAAPEPSSFAAARLPGATLAAAVDPPAGALGRRIVLSIEWEEPGRRGRPLRLAGWLHDVPGEAAP